MENLIFQKKSVSLHFDIKEAKPAFSYGSDRGFAVSVSAVGVWLKSVLWLNK